MFLTAGQQELGLFDRYATFDILRRARVSANDTWAFRSKLDYLLDPPARDGDSQLILPSSVTDRAVTPWPCLSFLADVPRV